jgi:hypothetical protein
MSDRCDQEVYDKGDVVFITNTIRSTRMEEWVQKIAQDSGQRVDWHQFAGRPVMKALGDLHEVRKAIVKNKDMHDQYYKEAVSEYKFFSDEDNDDRAWGIWKYNMENYELSTYLCSKCRGFCNPQNH